MSFWAWCKPDSEYVLSSKFAILIYLGEEIQAENKNKNLPWGLYDKWYRGICPTAFRVDLSLTEVVDMFLLHDVVSL